MFSIPQFGGVVIKNFFVFLWEIKKEATANEIMPLATTLTYRLIFALFPFLIFLIALVGYLDLDPAHLMSEISAILPTEIANTINTTMEEVTTTRSPAILSASLLISLFTMANGFRAIMRGINRIYHQSPDTRHIVKQWALCLLLVFIFATTIIAAIFIVIFFSPALAFIATAALFIFAIIIIYYLSNPQKPTLRSLIPGAAFTALSFALTTWGFNLYITHFANLSLIYGSIASIFLTMLWLNIISITILLGAQLNVKLRACSKSFCRRLCG